MSGDRANYLTIDAVFDRHRSGACASAARTNTRAHAIGIRASNSRRAVTTSDGPSHSKYLTLRIIQVSPSAATHRNSLQPAGSLLESAVVCHDPIASRHRPVNTSSAARVFASHYQIVVCTDQRALTPDDTWNAVSTARGYAGNELFRVVGTEADLNDHWVESRLSTQPPALADWHRVVCFSLQNHTGQVHVMSVVDDEPALTLDLPKGPYAVYVAARNLGVDQSTLGESEQLTDEQLALRKDLEWYTIFLVPGIPQETGRLKDEE